MIHPIREIPSQRCQLCECNNSCQLFELDSEQAEQVLQVYQSCKSRISYIVEQILHNISEINTLYKNKIELKMTSNKLFYKLRWTQCKTCFRICLCSKVCINEHFFCLNCLEGFIQNQFHNHNIKCLQYNCDQEIDDFIKFQFVRVVEFQKWASKYMLFCPQGCKTILRLFPFKKLETSIIQVDNNYSQCSSCKALICNTCWEQFKGTYTKHQNICNTDVYRIQLVKQLLNVFECPKCKCYSEQNCTMFQKKIQQCSYCGTKFCLFCKSAELELFNNEQPFHYNCNCYQKFIKRRRIRIIILYFIQFIYLLIIGFIVYYGHELSNFIESVVIYECNFRYKQCLYYIFFPLIIIFKLFAGFCSCVLSFEPILMNFTFKILGIQDEIEFFYQ